MPAGRTGPPFAAVSSLTGDSLPASSALRKRAGAPGGSSSFPGAWTVDDKADEADGLTPINEDNAASCCSGPGNHVCPCQLTL